MYIGFLCFLCNLHAREGVDLMQELYDQLADACGADWQQVRVMSEGFFKDLRV